MKTSEKTNTILPLLFQAKKLFEGVKKKSDNPFFKSKYATLNDHLDMVEPILEGLGLMLLQPVCMDANNNSYVDTMIVHAESGQFVSSQMPLKANKENDMQQLGSATTYARRFTLGSLLSLQAVDDDGEGAVRGLPGSKTAPTTVVTKVETKTAAPVTGAFKKPGSTAPAAAAPKTAPNGVAKKSNPVTDSEWT